MSAIAKFAMVLAGIAGAIIAVVAYLDGRDSTDAQEALVVPFVVFWTGLALVLIWMLDGIIRAVWRYFAKQRAHQVGQ